MKIKVGTLDVLYHGSFLIERGKSFEFDITDDGDEPMKLILFLTQDKNEQNYFIKPRLIDNTTLELNLVNFDHMPTGSGGSTIPFKLGTLKDRAFYFSFYLSVITDNVMPLFSYTFYLGEEEVKNG